MVIDALELEGQGGHYLVWSVPGQPRDWTSWYYSENSESNHGERAVIKIYRNRSVGSVQDFQRRPSRILKFTKLGLRTDVAIGEKHHVQYWFLIYLLSTSSRCTVYSVPKHEKGHNLWPISLKHHSEYTRQSALMVRKDDFLAPLPFVFEREKWDGRALKWTSDRTNLRVKRSVGELPAYYQRVSLEPTIWPPNTNISTLQSPY